MATEINDADSGYDSRSEALTQYDMNNKERGKALIISNKNFVEKESREGTEIDAKNLKASFIDLGFKVNLIEDASRKVMINSIEEVSAMDHTNCDAFVLALLSHGNELFISATDGLVYLERLLEPLKGDRCPSLASKPKIIIIQACRGNYYDDGAKNAINKNEIENETCRPDADPDVDDDDENPLNKIPREINFIYLYSCMPGYISYRETTGSWLINSFTEVLNDYKYSLEFTKILTLVNRKVSENISKASEKTLPNKKQASVFVSTLVKELYFKKKDENLNIHELNI